MAKFTITKIVTISAVAASFALTASAALVAPTDLNDIALGEPIIGPLGPVVPGSFGDPSLGDLESSVFCTPGRLSCPVLDDVETYTYTHVVTPAESGITAFSMGMRARGFAGVAGYDFDAAVEADLEFEVEKRNETDGSLIWRVVNGSWDPGERLTVFWQTSRRPSGPTGVYTVSGAEFSESTIGPNPIPEPGTFVLVALALLALIRPVCRR